MSFPRCLILSLVMVVFCASLPAEAPAFLDERLSPSPRLVQGVLPNGIRYGIMRHPQPPGHISLRLVVNAGSVMERDDEQGYAHFVEHMGFNGTEHFRSGEAIRYLQSEGVLFGSHFNADTSPNDTVYKLDLPNTKPELLERSFSMLGDFAGGVLFEPVEVDKERGVILSEALSRQTSQRAQGNALEAFLFAGTLYPSRRPIGTEKCVKAAKPANLKAFYDAWYRPERMAVVVVGDVDPTAIKALVEKHFAGINARGPARPEPELGNLVPVTKPRVLVWERSGQGANLSLHYVYPRKIFPPEQRVWRRFMEKMQLDFACRMLGDRLERLCSRQNRTLSDSRVVDETVYRRFVAESINISSSVKNAPNALAIAEQELRSALELGFSQSELDLVRKRRRYGMIEAARATETIPSNRLAADLADCYLDPQRVMLLPDELQDRFLQLMDLLTVEECQAALKAAFSRGEVSIFAAVPLGSKIQDSVFLKAYQESRTQPVSKSSEVTEVAFAYNDFGPPGKLKAQEQLPDLEARKLIFENGVVVFLKRTEFVRGEVMLSLRVGTGRSGEPKEHPGLGLFVGDWILGGLGKLSPEDLLLLTPSGKLGGSASAGSHSLELRGNCSRENLRKELCLFAAYISDPAFRQDAHEKVGAHLNGMLSNLVQSPDFVTRGGFIRYLSGGDKRIGFTPAKYLRECKWEDATAWLKAQLKVGPLELAVVGDLDLEETTKALADTFGALQAREPAPEIDCNFVYPEPGKVHKEIFLATKPQPTSLVFCWPLRDKMDNTTRVQMRMLSMILSDRLREQVREEKSATYVARASWVNDSEVYPGFCFLTASAEIAKGETSRYSKLILKIAAELGENGPKDEELERVRTQILTDLESSRMRNDYWLDDVFSGAERCPWHLDLCRDYKALVSKANLSNLRSFAKRVLNNKAVYRCEAIPEKPKEKS